MKYPERRAHRLQAVGRESRVAKPRLLTGKLKFDLCKTSVHLNLRFGFLARCESDTSQGLLQGLFRIIFTVFALHPCAVIPACRNPNNVSAVQVEIVDSPAANYLTAARNYFPRPLVTHSQTPASAARSRRCYGHAAYPGCGRGRRLPSFGLSRTGSPCHAEGYPV